MNLVVFMTIIHLGIILFAYTFKDDAQDSSSYDIDISFPVADLEVEFGEERGIIIPQLNNGIRV